MDIAFLNFPMDKLNKMNLLFSVLDFFRNECHFINNKPCLPMISRHTLTKKVREKSRECHNHKPQPFPDPKRKRKPTNINKHKPNKRTKSLFTPNPKTSFLSIDILWTRSCACVCRSYENVIASFARMC